MKQYSRRYYKSPHGKERFRLAGKKWRETESGRVTIKNNKARRRKAEGKFTLQEWNQVLASYNYKCAKCRSTDRIEVDHIIPISKGGKNTIDNIQPLCKSCNCKKGAKQKGGKI